MNKTELKNNYSFVVSEISDLDTIFAPVFDDERATPEELARDLYYNHSCENASYLLSGLKEVRKFCKAIERNYNKLFYLKQ